MGAGTSRNGRRSCPQAALSDELQRIDGLAVEQNLVVQMRARRAARRADIADHVAALDSLADADGIARQVAESRRDAIAVRDFDAIPVVAVVRGQLYRAVGRR